MKNNNAIKISNLSAPDDSYTYHRLSADGLQFADFFSSTPIKSPCTAMMLVESCQQGRIEVNHNSIELRRGVLVFIFPNNLVRTIGSAPVRGLDAHLLLFDQRFSQSVSINLASISVPTTIHKPSPKMSLSVDEADIVRQYFSLMRDTLVSCADDTRLQKATATTLLAALFYQLVCFNRRQLAAEIAHDSPNLRGTNRRNDYVREFVRLVHVNYTRERSVRFYADRLFISPKYLSMLVRDATGRTAAMWIDEFVLMEAKNLLRFSGKNIQQVAYALNFPSQSSFGKYFKHLTGLSPSEYQKS